MNREKLDLVAKKSESEWTELIDKFWLNFTPFWFQWLGWTILASAITFLAKKTGLRALEVLDHFNFIFMWFYFNAFFYRFEVTYRGKSNRWLYFTSVVLSSVLTFGTMRLTRYFIEVFMVNKP